MSRTRPIESKSSGRRPPAGGARRPAHHRRLEESVENAFRFFGSFLRRPGSVGSVLPSSASLARAMVRQCPLQTAKVVVELGPGTGAFTGPILDAIGPRTQFLAVELDQGHVRTLKRRFPRLHVELGSAADVEEFLRRLGVQQADCIVSGLPWGIMRADLQDRILQPVVRSLKPGGVFVAFGYVHARWLPATRRFLSRLQHHFGHVETSRIVWRNLPPAVVYRCSSP